ncbi:MAG: tetratricopeptide repeat protein [Fibrobacterota bacterium]
MLQLQNKILLSLSALTVMFFLVGCAGTKPADSMMQEDSPGALQTVFADTGRNLARASFYFVEAKHHERQGQYARAYEFYKGAWQYDPASEYLDELLPEYAARLQKPSEALFFITEGEPLADLPDSTVRSVISLYTRYKQHERVVLAFDELDSMSFFDTLVYVNALDNAEKYQQAISIFKNLKKSATLDSLQRENPEKENISREEFDLEIGDLYRKSGVYDSAEVYFSNLAEGDSPLSWRARRGLVLTRYYADKPAETYVPLLKEVYEYSLQNQRYFPVLTEMYARHVILSGKEYLRAVEIMTPVYTEALEKGKTSLARHYGKLIALYLSISELYERSNTVLDQLDELAPGDRRVQLYRGMNLIGLEQSDSAAVVFDSLIAESDSLSVEYYNYIIGSWIDAGDSTRGLNYTETLLKNHTDEPRALRLAALSYARLDRPERALACLEKLREQNDDFDGELLFEMAVLHDENGNFPAAEKLLKDIIAQDSSHSMAANYLGYSWAEDSTNLDEAQVLIARALQEHPNSGAYLDSYAWVLYRQGRYDSALVYIDKALARMKDDYIVYEHRGDILRALGHGEKARSAYGRALEFENLSPVDKKRLEKKMNELSAGSRRE